MSEIRKQSEVLVMMMPRQVHTLNAVARSQTSRPEPRFTQSIKRSTIHQGDIETAHPLFRPPWQMMNLK